jgi:hypothetical protein
MANDDWGSMDSNETDFEMDGTGTSADDLGGGNNVDREGWYHFEVADVVADLARVGKNGKAKSPSIRFDCLVMHPVNGQSPQGARHFHRIYVGNKDGGPASDGARNSAFRFGVGLGILREIEGEGGKSIVDAATGSPKINLATWQQAKGLQFIAKIAKEEVEEGSKFEARFQIPFGRVHQVDDPAVENVPRNKSAAKLATKAPAKPAAAGAAATAAPAPVAPSGGEIDEFADL